jgi:hypothetical protein
MDHTTDDDIYKYCILKLPANVMKAKKVPVMAGDRQNFGQVSPAFSFASA